MNDKKTQGTTPSASPALAPTGLLAAVERAYREGYQDGYQQGQDDASRYERGSGNPSANMQKRRENEAWETSLTKAANDQAQRPGSPDAEQT